MIVRAGGAEFHLLESSLSSYQFLSIDFIMPKYTASLDNFDCVTDIKPINIVSGMNKTTCRYVD